MLIVMIMVVVVVIDGVGVVVVVGGGGVDSVDTVGGGVDVGVDVDGVGVTICACLLVFVCSSVSVYIMSMSVLNVFVFFLFVFVVFVFSSGFSYCCCFSLLLLLLLFCCCCCCYKHCLILWKVEPQEEPHHTSFYYELFPFHFLFFPFFSRNGSDLLAFFSVESPSGRVTVQKPGLNYEQFTSYTVTVNSTDSGFPPYSVVASFLIAVKNLNEVPHNISLSNNKVN